MNATQPTATEMAAIAFLRLAGRCSDGAERGKGSLYHAVPHPGYKALCGAKPGRMSAGWSCSVGDTVTCVRCMEKLSGISWKRHWSNT